MTAKTEVINIEVFHPELKDKINLASQYQAAFIRKRLPRLASENGENAQLICDYIIAEQTEMNIKESKEEGRIKCEDGNHLTNHKS